MQANIHVVANSSHHCYSQGRQLLLNSCQRTAPMWAASAPFVWLGVAPATPNGNSHALPVLYSPVTKPITKPMRRYKLKLLVHLGAEPTEHPALVFCL